MNNRKVFGIVIATIALCAIISLFNIGTNNSILSWPLEAYLGLVFSIGWLTNIPASLVYLIAALIFILIAVAFYKMGSWVYGLVMS